jgi:hypothetical protein
MEPIQVALIAAAALVAGFGLSRLISSDARRLRELGGLLEVATKEKETADATLARVGDDLRATKHALEVARGELAMTREELEGYRQRVAEHFTGTSEQLRALAQQYSAVYRHLAAGAADLCPEGFVGLEGNGLDFLPSSAAASTPPEPEASETNPASRD